MGQNNTLVKKYIDEHCDEIKELYNQGLGILGIAAQFGVSSTPIRRVLREVGVQFRRGYEVLAAKGGPPKGINSKKWKGGRWINKNGYVLIYAPDHPVCRNSKYPRLYLLEHRLVMEKHLGRYLEPHEHVHHIGSDRANNVIENLKLVSSVEHGTIHNPQWSRETRPCENCGDPVSRCPSQFFDHVFCSQDCYHAFLTPLASKNRWAGKGHGKRTVYCGHCGKSIERWPSHINEHNFCSTTCKGAAGHQMPRGQFQTKAVPETE